METPEFIPQSVIDETGTIISDMACRRCGYNLRGLNQQSRCPECNTPAGLSTQGDLLRFADPNWVDRLSRGCSFILWGTLATLLASFGVGCLMFIGLVPIGQIVAFLASLISVYGAWLLTSPDPSGIGDDRYANARKIVRITLILGLASGFTNLGLQNLSLPLVAFVVLMSLNTLAGLTSVVGEVAKYFYLRTLADRIPHPEYAARARLIAWAFAIGLPIVLLGSMLAMVAMLSGSNTPGGTFSLAAMQTGMRPGSVTFSTTATGTPPTGIAAVILMVGGCLSAIAGVALIVFYILALILIYRLGQAFREQAYYARATWAMHVNREAPNQETSTPPVHPA